VDISGFYRQQDVASQIGQISSLLIQNTVNIVSGIASALFATFLVLVLSFYIMVDGGRLTQKVIGALPLRRRDEPLYFIESVERSFGGFIRGQVIQCLIYGAGTAVIMLALGVNYVLVSSLFAGLMMLVPFVGPVVAILPPVLIALLQGSFVKVVIVAVALLVLQQVVINVIVPKLMSEAVGLPPLLVILALLIGGKLAGIMGAIFGVPVAAVAYAMLLFLYHRSSMAENALADVHDPGARVHSSRANEQRPSRRSSIGRWARHHFDPPKRRS
jgi:predicted PurR-regulated permease PerM